MHTKFWLENLKGRDYLVEQGIDGRVILKWIIEKQDGKVWTGFIWLRTGLVAGSCEHVNELLGSIKVRNFLTT
jgi:hypothetical protein